MTLTTVLPSLRRSIPDPLDSNRWPEHTRPTTTDVTVSGVSMMRLVDLCGSPCIHSAAASIPGSGGRPSRTHDASVVVATVTDIWHTPDGSRIVVLDANLDTARPVWQELRLIGRASTIHSAPAMIVGGPAGVTMPAPTLQLPGDLATSDLVAVPCTGIPCLRDLRAE